MYELTCPACHQKSQHVFVRIGAKTSCAHCQHRYQLGNEQVQRNVQLPAEDNTTPNPLLFGSPVTKPPAPAHPTQVRRQQDHRQNSNNPPLMTPEVDPTLHPAPKPKPPAEVQRMIAQRRAQRERKRLIIRVVIFFLGTTLAITLLIYMFMMARQIDEVTIKSDDGTTVFQNEPDASQSDLDAMNMVTIMADRLASPFWRLANNKPYEEPTGPNEIQLESGNLVSRDETNMTYVASYTVHSAHVIELAILHLSLINSQNRVIATNQIPMTLLTDTTIGLRSHGTISVKVPRDLASQMTRMGSSTEVLLTMGNSIALREPMIESHVNGEDATLLIAAYNPLDKPLDRCVFSVLAIDKRGEELAHWRVNWQRQVDPRQRVEFTVKLQISKLWSIGGWKLVAFGESEKPQ